MWEIILPGESLPSKEETTDKMLAQKLDDVWFSMWDTIDEMAELMEDAKANKSSEALKLRLDLIKHAQALHWSKAWNQNINIWIFTHPPADKKLNY